jgi:8-oxo-dGTP pyrophosphatase MutT (NUDIX family)
MWGETTNVQYKNEELSSSKKMELIRNGVIINDENVTLKSVIENSKTEWNETEWEFPKGRRNNKEKDLECALREFEEETGINKNKISVVENILPFEEIFIGTNHKSYKHKYFLAYMEEENEEMEDLEHYQVTEVSKIEWKTIDKCLESIRPYNLEKKKLITNINKVLEEYRLYS